jgi:hypothetical protein
MKAVLMQDARIRRQLHYHRCSLASLQNQVKRGFRTVKITPDMLRRHEEAIEELENRLKEVEHANHKRDTE